jgi:hypothetical protein
MIASQPEFSSSPSAAFAEGTVITRNSGSLSRKSLNVSSMTGSSSTYSMVIVTNPLL